MEIRIKNKWDDITWGEYEQLEQILATDIPSDFKTVHIIALLTGLSVNEVETLPITAFSKLLPNLDFLQTEPETHTHKFEYTVNDHDYVFRGRLEEISTAQYIDYRTYIQEENKDVVKLMSCFLIPKDHDYNDGYDMEQVQKDINDMCWLDVRAAAFFFKLQLATYILTLKSSLAKTMRQNKKEMRKKKYRKQIQEMEESLNNTASSLLSAK